MSDLRDGFNVRVYGLLIEGDQVLVSHENYGGSKLTKFPGGGVEKGEAPGEALIREFKEEAGIDVSLGDFFYVSPNFHRSYFRPMQLISLYWRVGLQQGQAPFLGHDQPQAMDKPGNFHQLIWQTIDSSLESVLTSGLDKEVVAKLLKAH
jgi:8-oxo-dGTP pyrophosphatase MutT (NUDIX family)